MTITSIGKSNRLLSRDWSRLTPLLGLLIVLLVALAFAPQFFQPTNIGNLVRQAAILAIVASGQTLVLLVRGIDLSVGAVMTFSMVLMARASGGRDEDLVAAVLLAIAFGVIVGLINGGLVVFRRVPPFVATLAVAVLLAGLQTAWTQGVPGGGIPPFLDALGSYRLSGIPAPTIVAVVVIGLLAVALIRTTWGKWIYAAGSNPEAARVAGVPVGFGVITAYVASAVLAVIAGLLLGGYSGYVDGYLGVGYDLDSIAAAVIGGTAFTGGVGGIGRTVIGSIIIAAVLNVIVLTGAPEWLQLVVKGSIIIVAVAVQMVRWGRRGG